MSSTWGASPPASTEANLEVTLADRGRIARVDVRSLPDPARRPQVFNEAFQEAVSRARSATRPAAPGVVGPDGRVRAARVVAPPSRPLRELVEEAIATRDPHRRPVGSGDAPEGRVTGTSDNDCVTVVLDPSGPGGELEIDAGWLSHAARQSVGAAVQQAFTAAYEIRESR